MVLHILLFRTLQERPGQSAEVLLNRNAIGYMKVAPNGKYIATAVSSGDRFVELFKFDTRRGIISEPIRIDSLGNARAGENNAVWDVTGPYGLEFSPNSDFLYVGIRSFEQTDDPTNIYQFDISSYEETAVQNSKEVIAFDKQVGALLLGPDHRIYVAKKNSRYLGVIEAPNEKGKACLYEERGVLLSNSTSGLGLPNNFPIRHKKLNTAALKVQLFPNPSNGENIRLQFNQAHQELELIVYNLKGIEICRKTTNDTTNHIQLDDLEAGVYLYTILYRNETIKNDRLVHSSIILQISFLCKKATPMLSVFSDESFMKEALKEAQKAFDKGEVPIGAIIVSENRIIARAHNLTEQLNDVTAHAEMQAFTAAADTLGAKYLHDCTPLCYHRNPV